MSTVRTTHSPVGGEIWEHHVRFDSNALILLDNDNNPRGTRVFGAVPRELRVKFNKVLSLAAEVV